MMQWVSQNFTQEDFAAAESYLIRITTVMQQHQSPRKKLIELDKTHGVELLGRAKKKMVVLMALLLLGRKPRLA